MIGTWEDENPSARVKFGSLSHQEMPIEWAQEMLTKWRERHPAQFGKMLAEVVTSPPAPAQQKAP
jgi:hypothetical protein